jgi:hypothetical protein
VGQKTDRNRARLPSLFGMKFTQVPSQYSNWFAEQTMPPNNSVALCLIMVQRGGEKQSWITSGGHTLIGIHLECCKQMTITKITVGNLAINWYL